VWRVKGEGRRGEVERGGEREAALGIEEGPRGEVNPASREFQPSTEREGTSKDVWQDQPGQAPF